MDIESNITRKINLDQNDGLSAFLGYTCQQHHGIYKVFYDFLKEVRPANILEIGTALGGFTQYINYINKNINNSCRILSYDIYEKSWYTELISEGIDVRVENIFLENYSSVNPEVIDFIKSPGTTVVFCDGGSKVDEFNLLSYYLKPKDYILAHDYCYSREIFEENIKGKIWNWCEIIEDDIHSACTRNNLQDYNHNIFNSVVWTCKVKV